MNQSLVMYLLVILLGAPTGESNIQQNIPSGAVLKPTEQSNSQTVVSKGQENPNGQVLQPSVLGGVDVQKVLSKPYETATPEFKVEEISDSYKKVMTGLSWGQKCPVPISKLRLVKVGYTNFEGKSMQGEVIVHKAVAEEVVGIFKDLYKAQYPICKVQLIDLYKASDDASMADDNTSGFNYRNIPGSKSISKHSYGIAIDINPVENPYKTSKSTIPENGKKYTDRTLNTLGMIKVNDVCYSTFTKKGWSWGGSWKNSKDWQHFEKNISTSKL